MKKLSLVWANAYKQFCFFQLEVTGLTLTPVPNARSQPVKFIGQPFTLSGSE